MLTTRTTRRRDDHAAEDRRRDRVRRCGNQSLVETTTDTTFEIASTGGRFCAIAGTIGEPLPTWRGKTHARATDLILITDANATAKLARPRRSSFQCAGLGRNGRKVLHHRQSGGL
jgi:hypothetical protein